MSADAPASTSGRLPRGRHQLSRDQVAADQRRRMLGALADAMAEKGYVGTTVADVLRGAGVSRETFYQQFDSKQDCFLAAFEALRERVVHAVVDTPTGIAATGPLERFDALLERYLSALASDVATARLFLVEIYAAGPDAVRRRIELQEDFVEAIAGVFGAETAEDRFAARALVAAVATLCTNALVDDGAEAVLALRRPLADLAGRLLGPR